MRLDWVGLRQGARWGGGRGRPHASAPAGLQEARDFGFGDGSRSDHEAWPGRELEEHGEELCRCHVFRRLAPRRSLHSKSKINLTCNRTPGQAESAGNLESRATIGSKESGHFKDAVIVIALAELRGRGIVDDESHVGMELKGGSGNRGGDGAFDGLRNGGRLRLARGEQKT